VGRKVHLKLETLQKTGPFKIRGAYYKISKLRSSVNAKGVVAVSARNHAQGVPLAALLKGEKEIKGSNSVLVISGGNIDDNLIDRIITQGLAKTGRIFRIAVDLRDVPGALATLSRVTAAKGANMLHIRHDRISKGIPVGCSKVVLELETAGFDHIQEILETLKEEEYAVEQT
jgi:threonine dehydratase